MIGTFLCDARYEIIERIGDGGAAIVYRARDHALGRDVAVKILRSELAEDHEFVERFRREAHAAAGLSHPNIASVFDIGSEGGRQFFVMELLSGGTLRQQLSRGPLPTDRALEIAQQVAGALRHAHSSGIIHRDIKPENILFTRDGDVKVADFGIARALAASSVSQTGQIIGSVRYLAPEQAGGEGAVAQSDIYSLGVVLYEMLTGEVPFDGETPVSIALKHVQEPPRPLRAVNPKVPPAVEDVVSRMLAKRPQHRQASAEELASELRAVAAGVVLQSADQGASGPQAADRTRVIPQTDSMRRAYRAQGAEEARPSRPAEASPQFSPLTWVLVFFTALVGIAGIAFMVMSRPPQSEGQEDPDEATVTKMIRVPDVRYGTLYEARTVADRAGLIIEPEYVDGGDTYPPDTVLDQSPKPGETLPEHGTLKVWVARVAVEDGESATVPDVSGMSFERAEAEMKRAGLAVARMELSDEEIPAGYVIRQSPEPETVVPSDTEVTLFVSTGPRQEFDPGDIIIDGPDNGPRVPIRPDGPDTPSTDPGHNGEPPGDEHNGEPPPDNDQPSDPGDDDGFGRSLIDLVPATPPTEPGPSLQRPPGGD